MDGGARWATVHGVEKSQTRLSNFTFPFCFINELHAWIFLLSSNRAHRGSRRAPAGWGGSRSLPGQPAACPPRSLSPPGVPACTGCPSIKGLSIPEPFQPQDLQVLMSLMWPLHLQISVSKIYFCFT